MVGRYDNEHLNSHVLEFKKCFTRYLRLKCINNKYSCQKQWIAFVLRRIFSITNSKFQISMLLPWQQEQKGPNSQNGCFYKRFRHFS